MFKQNGLNALKDRGFVYQMTHADEIEKMLTQEPTVFYLGIDPTADALHIGHFFSLVMFRILQDHGHKGILVIGGATALIGDPTGKKDMRKMLTKEQVKHNTDELMALVKRFIKMDGENPATVLNNHDWFHDYAYIDFMREIGVHFNVNTMLSSEAYKNRLQEGGLTFLEMGYMLMQAYDFVYLNRKYGCSLQIGGSDQWGNIVAGVDLGRKLALTQGTESNLSGLTCPLLTTSDGIKMGKTEKGTLWVSRDKTSVYDFYQHFYNALDADVERLLRFFTAIPVSEIQALCASDIREAKRRMAFEVTKLVHGEEEAKAAEETSKLLFSGNLANENAPTVEIPSAQTQSILAVDFLALSGIIASKSEGRRLIDGGAFTIDGEKVTAYDQTFTYNTGATVLVKKGKKNFVQVKIV